MDVRKRIMITLTLVTAVGPRVYNMGGNLSTAIKRFLLGVVILFSSVSWTDELHERVIIDDAYFGRVTVEITELANPEPTWHQYGMKVFKLCRDNRRDKNQHKPKREQLQKFIDVLPEEKEMPAREILVSPVGAPVAICGYYGYRKYPDETVVYIEGAFSVLPEDGKPRPAECNDPFRIKVNLLQECAFWNSNARK